MPIYYGPPQPQSTRPRITSSALSLTLSGVTATIAGGLVTCGQTCALTTATAATTYGSFALTQTDILAGASVSAIGGSPVTSQAVLDALGGLSVGSSASAVNAGQSDTLLPLAATAGSGNLTKSLVLALAGNAVTSAAGTVGYTLGSSVTGLASTIAFGPVVEATSSVLSGGSGASQAGNVSTGIALIPIGPNVVAASGVVVEASTEGLVGAADTSVAGTLAPYQLLIGAAAATATDAITPFITFGLAGASTTLSSGNIGVVSTPTVGGVILAALESGFSTSGIVSLSTAGSLSVAGTLAQTAFATLTGVALTSTPGLLVEAIGSSLVSASVATAIVSPGPVVATTMISQAPETASIGTIRSIHSTPVVLAGTVATQGLRLWALARAQSASTLVVGAITKALSRTLAAASMTPLGSAAKQTAQTVTAGINIATRYANTTTRAIGANVVLVGSSIGKAIGAALKGTTTIAGAVAKGTQRAMNAGITITGTGSRGRVMVFSAISAFTVAFWKNGAASFTAFVGPFGAANKAISRVVNAALTSSGTFLIGHLHNLNMDAVVAILGITSRATSRMLSAVTSLSANLISSVNNLYALTFAATVPLTATVTKALSRILNGQLATSTGAFAKNVARTISGSIATASTIAFNHINNLVFTVTLSVASEFGKTIGRSIQAIIAFSTSQTHIAQRTLAAVVAAVGVIQKRVPRSLSSGTIAAFGSVTNRTSRALAAVMGGAGLILHGAQKTVSGAIAASSLAGKTLVRSITATTIISAAIGRRLNRTLSIAQLAISGALRKTAGTPLSGSVSPAGNLGSLLLFVAYVAFTASVNVAGTIGRTIARTIASSVAPSATLNKLLARPIAATLNATIALGKVLSKSVTATVALAGTINARLLVFLSFADSALRLTGNAGKATQKTEAAVTTPTANIQRALHWQLASTLAPIAKVTQQLARSLEGTALASGSLGKGFGRLFAGVASVLGAIANFLAMPVTPILHPYVMMATPITALHVICTPILIDAEE